MFFKRAWEMLQYRRPRILKKILHHPEQVIPEAEKIPHQMMQKLRTKNKPHMHQTTQGMEDCEDDGDGRL